MKQSAETSAEAANEVVHLITAAQNCLKDVLNPLFLDRMRRYSDLIALWGAKFNLTAHPADPSETAFHIIDSLFPLAMASGGQLAALAASFADGKHIIDIGSGAGFPGLVLASACEADFTLVEARRHRTSFLQVAAGELGLANVKVLAQRASGTNTPAGQFDLAITRALGNLAEFYGLSARALVAGGKMLLYASPSQRLSLEAAKAAGFAHYVRHSYSVPRLQTVVERVAAVWQKLG